MNWRTKRLAVGAMAAALLLAGAGVFAAVRANGRQPRSFGSPAAPTAPAATGVSPTSTPITSGLLGRLVEISLSSPAIGGRIQPVLVYLPPGYADQPGRHYPVLYLLHGSPGGVRSFLDMRMPQLEERLLAQHRMQPLILVMPQGVRGSEWADEAAPGNDWETFVALDVVRTIDSRFRTIAAGRGRAIGGLSEGGYGAINIALHHPGEFHVVESWSGYEYASPGFFGRNRRLIAYNSPAVRIQAVAAALRATQTRFWFYIGWLDHLRIENERFAEELASLRIDYRFFAPPGRHNVTLWTAHAPEALMVASAFLA